MSIQLGQLGQVQPNFEWRKRGARVRPEAMATRHLFMTLVAIWNATCGRGQEITKSGPWRHRMYTFDPEYDVRYLHTAIVCLAFELSKRSDLEDCWWDTLELILERATRKKVT